MYLKSLEMSGFKSFPDRTVIDFSDGLTAIVGPNGSGKSNIADAIRWVLGEQSSRSLRGSKMEDVVFAGTESRGPVGFAEVTLTIDNTAHILDIDYAEVAVTRRYYRSGESEFYINKQAVRLTDIRRLFMDTGLGRDGYSVIGQGRIDEILSVRSEDRREVFEEAAGITLLRSRKEDAERKLAGAEENLVRIRDITTELESQLEPLKAQSEKAQAFLILRDELRQLEIDVWMEELDRLRQNSIRAGADLDTAQTDLGRARTQVDALYEENERLLEEMQKKELEGERQREQLRETEQRVSDAKSAAALLRGSIENNERSIERMNKELTESENRADSLSAQMESHKSRIAELEQTDGQLRAELEQHLGEITRLASSENSLAARLDALRAQKVEEEARASDARLRQGSLQSAMGSAKEQLAAAEESLRARQSSLANERGESKRLAAELEENNEKRDAALNVIKGYELRAASRRQKYESLREQSFQLLMQINNQKSRRQTLHDMEREYEGFSNSVRTVMRRSAQGALSNIHGTVAELITVPDEYTTAIEIALGGGLQNIVTSTEEDAKAAIAFLKTSGQGRATFLPVSSVRGSELTERGLASEPALVGIASSLVSYDEKYKNIFTNLLGRTAVVNDIDAAIAMARKYGYRFRIVTLDGQVLNPGGSMTGGSAGKNTGVLSRANEIARIDAELASLTRRADALSRDENQAEREFKAADYELEVARGEQRTAEDALLEIRSAITRHDRLVEALEADVTALEGENARLSARIAELRAGAELAGEEIAAHGKAAADFEAQAGELTRGREDITGKSGSLAETVAGLRERLAGIAAELTATRRNLEEITGVHESMRGDRENAGAVIADLRKQNLEMEQQIKTKEGHAAMYETAAALAREALHGLTAERMAAEGRRGENERDARERNNEVLRLEREVLRLEHIRDNAESEERQITDRLWENYEITFSEAASLRRPVENMQKANRRIGELKNRRKAMGDVNIGAIEEYKHISERYGFLSSQRDDLEKSKTDIEGLIAGILKDMEETFARQFEQISEKFKETFKDLFGGGHAELALTDESDILNCGIEIRAQPPGKTLKTLLLLSGGERAFVAIALFFAILKVKPTPFCVLDEIEAALDDVNVVRFARYLRGCGGSSQFIVITHRRGTMEESDMLYGVTMQERGVSKILSMNLEQIEKKFKLG